MQSIQELVRKAEENYVRGDTKISKYVDYSMYEVIETIYAYLNSKHISGSTDSQGREKPFFNIVTAAVNIWYRATDIDRKNIRIKANKISDYTKGFLATVHLNSWMKKARFGQFLNEWGRALSQYGSSVVKFVEKDGVLHANVIPWSRLIVDSIDFGKNVKIEKLFFTPSELRQQDKYDKTVVDNLIANVSQAREDLEGHKKDNMSDYIEVYEVHGEMPLSFLTDEDKDEDTYRQQMHVISFQEKKDKGGFEEFTLYSGKEAKDPYMLTHLIAEEGRTLSIGAVESLFDAQWMQNHTIKNMKDQLDLASKLVFQTADANYTGRNVLTAIEQGDILIHADNQPLTQVNNGSHDIASLQAFAREWKVLSQELTSTPDAVRGNTMPSGTAYRQVAILNNEANSLFEIMVENKGLHLEDMLREFIIPHLKKQMNNGDEVAATLEAHDLTQIDSIYIPIAAKKAESRRVIGTLLEGGIPSPVDTAGAEAQIRQQLSTLGNTRFFTPDDAKKLNWNEIFKDFEWEVDIEITNENTDKEVVLTTLSTVLQNIAGNPGLLQDPNARMIFSRILEETGRISPIEIAQAQAQPQASPPANGGAGVLPVA